MLVVTTERREDHYFDIYINGKFFQSIKSFFPGHIFYINNYEDFVYLINYSFSELANNSIEQIIFNDIDDAISTNYYFSYEVQTTYNLEDDLKDDSIGFNIEEVNLGIKANNVSLILNFRYNDWKKLYSIKEFQSFLNQKITTSNFLGEKAQVKLINSDPFDNMELLTIEFTDIDDSESPFSYIEKFMPLINNLINEVIAEMDNQYSLDVYSTYFNFPPAYKTSCKQYLMYFAQFLLDLGISVNTEVKDTPEGTFFSVIPQDKNEAIENIKELLAIYMDAPNSLKDNDLAIHQSDIAITQFHANILHLRSQLAFANTLIEMKQATIQLKDATIQSLNLTNYQLSEEIKHQATKDEESIISGVVSVKKVETYGFNINLPEILRRLKRKL